MATFALVLPFVNSLSLKMLAVWGNDDAVAICLEREK